MFSSLSKIAQGGCYESCALQLEDVIVRIGTTDITREGIVKDLRKLVRDWRQEAEAKNAGY